VNFDYIPKVIIKTGAQLRTEKLAKLEEEMQAMTLAIKEKQEKDINPRLSVSVF